MTIVTSEYWDQHPKAVFDAAAERPVCITETGQNAYVLMSIDAYKQLIGEEALSAILSKHADSDVNPNT